MCTWPAPSRARSISAPWATWWVGWSATARPYFRFEDAHEVLAADSPVREDRLKTLGAAMAASGAVALYHVERITPEARRRDMLAPGAEVLSVDSLEEGVRALNGPLDVVDFVSVGCPHASLAEIAEIAYSVSGKRLQAHLWVTHGGAYARRGGSAGMGGRDRGCWRGPWPPTPAWSWLPSSCWATRAWPPTRPRRRPICRRTVASTSALDRWNGASRRPSPAGGGLQGGDDAQGP